jgi:hypothetical protein
MNQASYDLTRMRHNGLIVRVPDHHRYTLTPEGIQFETVDQRLAHARLRTAA